MAKFSILSVLSRRKAAASPDTINLAGGHAHSQSAKLELVSALITTFLKDEFYLSEKEVIERLRTLIARVNDPVFAAKAALYARHAHGMRSTSHLVAGEIARTVKGAPWTANFYDKVVRRPDDILEILGYHLATTGRPIPNSLKKGLGRALSRLDERQLAKYRRGHATFKMVDAINLLHPKSTPALAKLMRGELAPAETWETRLTQAGCAETDAEVALAKRAAWSELVQQRQLGYLALLRNLRNILSQAPDLVDEVVTQLTDPAAIKRSLVYPFQFLSAVDALSVGNLPQASRVIAALSTAVDLSLANIPDFEGRTLVALDVSGSMQGQPLKIGSLFAAVLAKRCNAELLTFSDSASYRSLNLKDSTLGLAKSLDVTQGGTNFNAIFATANKAYERIIILSDMQAWVGGGAPKESFAAYRKRHAAAPRIFSFDLKGLGTLQFPEPNVYALAGWSERSFGLLTKLDRDPAALLAEVEAMQLAA